jgi:kynurenine formamidase
MSLRSAIVMIAMFVPTVSAADPVLSGAKVIDLSHALREGIPVFPGGTPFQMVKLSDIEKGYYLNRLSLGEHTGTHVDAPNHFAKGGAAVADLRLKEDLTGPLVVIDVEARAAANMDLALEIDDIRAFERTHEIPAGAFVVLRTGWYRKWSDPEKYVNLDANKSPRFPGFGGAAAKYLAIERKVRGLGIDTLSTDPGQSADFPAHKAVLGAGRINIENMAALDEVPATGATLMVVPMKIAGGSGGPARVYAFVPAK